MTCSCVANICYKIFENVDSMKTKILNEDCIRILDVLVRNYRHQSVAAIKIIQQLQHFEHLSSVWAVAVAEFTKQGQGLLQKHDYPLLTTETSY
uniref:Uncharacterized protein n=1 Tax=Romanomermis culicivorax TaxID=13658 RepID=A0A915J7B4_ROMCU